MRRWIKVYDFEQQGREPQELNTVRVIEVEGRKYCMARLHDGYFAVDNMCPHAGGPLGVGWCDHDGNVICPVHRYKYDMRTGRGKMGDYVQPSPVETRDDGVYIGVKKNWWWPF
jgi:3-phenylpropionate/trans-cinnamate dioxygenase ferredoxin subunit